MKIIRKHRIIIAIMELAVLTLAVVGLKITLGGNAIFAAENFTALGTFCTVILLYYTLKFSRQSAEDAERPHISIMLRMTSHTNRILVITNSGRTTAKNTRLSLDDVQGNLRVINADNYYLDETQLFTTGADLPSGWLYEFFLQHGSTYAADPDGVKHPRRFTIKVNYESLSGTKYEDEIPIDIGAHRHSVVPKHSVAENIHLLTKELIPAITSLHDEVQKIRVKVEGPPTHFEDGSPIYPPDVSSAQEQ